jgi:hypothetical protein
MKKNNFDVCINIEQLESMLDGLEKLEKDKFNLGESNAEALDMIYLFKQMLQMVER